MELSSTTLSIGQSRIALREDLRFHHRGKGSRAYYVVEDQVSGKFFQVGKLEYSFLSMLDGDRTVSQVIEKLAKVRPEFAMTQVDAARICQWAIESRIVKRELTFAEQQVLEKDEFVKQARTWLNPVTLKIPVGQPDAIIERLETVFGWCWQRSGLILWMLVCGFAFLSFVPVLNQFINQQAKAFSPQDMFWIVVAWTGLKLLHELAHAVACKSYGCSVRSCGLILLLLIPLPYVDVTESWRLPNKWNRILVSAAGMIAEVFVAAIACLIWVWSSPGVLQTHAGNLIIAATIHTILFNANPLMRFDGYYILSDWIGIPNLSTLGRAHTKSVLGRLFLGTGSAKLEETGWRLRFIKLYGWLALLWSFLISTGIVLAAYSLFSGVGLVLALVASVFWYGLPIFSFCKYLIVGDENSHPNRLRFAIVLLVLITTSAMALALCPGPSAVSAPLVLRYEPLHIVRAKTEGMIQKIHVINGQNVKQGELLLTLENHQLDSKVESLRIDIEIARNQINSLISRRRIAEVKLKEELLQSMNKQLLELEKSAIGLQIRASTDGEILARNLRERDGTYLHVGDNVLEIAASAGIHATAMVSQNDVSWFKENASQCSVLVDGLPSFRLLEGKVDSVSPRATQEISHPAFDGSQGGLLPVLAREQVTSSAGAESKMIHSQPWFEVSIELDVDDRHALRAGQTGTLYLYSKQQSIGQYAWDRFWQVVAPIQKMSHGI